MMELSYRTSLHANINLLLPEYYYSAEASERVGKMLSTITEGQARYLYRLCLQKKRIELKLFIVAHI